MTKQFIPKGFKSSEWSLLQRNLFCFFLFKSLRQSFFPFHIFGFGHKKTHFFEKYESLRKSELTRSPSRPAKQHFYSEKPFRLKSLDVGIEMNISSSFKGIQHKKQFILRRFSLKKKQAARKWQKNKNICSSWNLIRKLTGDIHLKYPLFENMGHILQKYNYSFPVPFYSSVRSG